MIKNIYYKQQSHFWKIYSRDNVVKNCVLMIVGPCVIHIAAYLLEGSSISFSLYTL